jgi:ResB-like family protein
MQKHLPPSTGESRNIHSGHAIIFCIVLILVCSLFQSLILSQFIEGPFAGSLYQWSFLIIVLTGTLAAAFRYRRDLFFRLNSLKFAMVLIGFICLAMFLSTLIGQRLGSEAYRQRYGIILYAVIRSLHLNNIYSSLWFLAMQLFLAASLVVCIIREKPWRTRLIGFAMCHAGIVIILAGITVGKFASFKGRIELRQGEGKRTLTLERAAEISHFNTLPFSIQLDDTRLEKHPQRFSVYLMRATGRRGDLKTFASLPVEPGRSMDVYEAGSTLKILEYYPDGDKKTFFVEHTGSPAVSVANVRVESETTKLEQRFIGGHPEKSTMPDTLNSYLISYSWEAPSEVELGSLAYKPDSKLTDEHWFEVRYSNVQKEEAIIRDVEPGGTYQIPKSGYTITPELYFRHFNFDLASSSASDASDEPVNPAMAVTLRNSENPGEPAITKRLFDHDPGFTNISTELPFDVIYHRMKGRSTYKRHYLIIGSLREIWSVADGVVETKKAFELNKNVEFSEDGTFFIVTELYENAREREVYFSKSDQPNNPYIRMGIESGGTTRSVMMSALEPEPVPLNEGEYFAVFQPRNEPQIKDYICDVSLRFEGEEIYKGKTSINDPFNFGSYYIYHNDFSRDDLGFVNLTVVYDPGYKLVLAGFFLLILGVIHALFIKPLLSGGPEPQPETDPEIGADEPKVIL